MDDATAEAARQEADAVRARQEAERTASRERAEVERKASHARAESERLASRQRATTERFEARRRRGRGDVHVSGVHPELGDYSHVMFDGDRTYYLAGQVPVGPDGEPAAGDIASQARQVMENLSAALEAAELDTSAVVKLTVFLTDPADAPAFAEVRSQFFSQPYPASSMVVVSSLLDPSWKVEVEAVAVEPPHSEG